MHLTKSYEWDESCVDERIVEDERKEIGVEADQLKKDNPASHIVAPARLIPIEYILPTQTTNFQPAIDLNYLWNIRWLWKTFLEPARVTSSLFSRSPGLHRINWLKW